MIVTCPNCSVRFLVDNTALGETGRKVKCGSCGHIWHQAPPERAPVDPPEEAPAAATAGGGGADTAAPAAKAPRQAQARRGLPLGQRLKGLSAKAILLWLAVFVLVGGLAGTGITFREGIIATWPPAARFYALIGMPVPALGEGLAIQDTSLFREQRGNRQTLVVEGLVRNTSDSIKEVPTIRVSLLDGQQRQLNWVTLDPPDARLLPGETTTFQTGIKEPHDAAVSAQVTFTRDKAGLRYAPGMKKPEPVGEGSSGGEG